MTIDLTIKYKNILRKDKPNYDCAGYYVKICRKKVTYDKFFTDNSFGSHQKALKAAIAYRDKTLATYITYTKKEIATKLIASNTSGISNIALHTNNGYKRWRVAYKTSEGKLTSKSFSINKYGNNEAKRLALEFHEQVLKNTKGFVYKGRIARGK